MTWSRRGSCNCSAEISPVWAPDGLGVAILTADGDLPPAPPTAAPDQSRPGGQIATSAPPAPARRGGNPRFRPATLFRPFIFQLPAASGRIAVIWWYPQFLRSDSRGAGLAKGRIVAGEGRPRATHQAPMAWNLPVIPAGALPGARKDRQSGVSRRPSTPSTPLAAGFHPALSGTLHFRSRQTLSRKPRMAGHSGPLNRRVRPYPPTSPLIRLPLRLECLKKSGFLESRS